jgi:DNA polymerase III alpha subunit (gram-positive type)
MLLLFLDTETSGLEPYKSQIIELGGIIYELDEKTLKLKEIDSFSNLLKLRREFDDKITRITKITKEDLMSATSQTKVQTDWESWLSKYEITAIIGHSIDFDLRFLKFEGWFLRRKKCHLFSPNALSASPRKRRSGCTGWGTWRAECSQLRGTTCARPF